MEQEIAGGGSAITGSNVNYAGGGIWLMIVTSCSLIIQGHLMVVDQVAIYLADMLVLQELMEQVAVVLEMDGMVILKQMHLEVLVDLVLL